MTDETTMDSIAAEDAALEAMADPVQEERLALAIPAGLGAALIGAVLWALFVYITEYQVGLVVILIGALIGYVIRMAGRGSRPVFGVLGAICAALAWALGTVLCDIAFLSQESGRSFGEVVGLLGIGQTISFAIGAADVMDLVFLGIALWEGYKFSIKPAEG